MELPFAHQVIYHEEAARARVPGPLGTGLNIAAPTIIKYGTQEQKQRWLAPMLRGDTVWAQGYSEPEAGSDLPSLRTTARADGDEYVVNGQKVWTSHAGDADVFFALVRTGTRQSRQKGITYLVIDAHAPGVQVRPMRDLTGGHLFAEVFFDDVRVPAANRIGEENGGWPLARTSLGHERAAGALNQAAMYRRVLTELEELARERGQLADPLMRDRFVDLEIRVQLIRYNAERTVGGILARGEAGAASSVSRLLITAFEQDIHEFAVDLLGPAGLLGKSAPQAVQRSRWLTGFLRTRASTIGRSPTTCWRRSPSAAPPPTRGPRWPAAATRCPATSPTSPRRPSWSANAAASATRWPAWRCWREHREIHRRLPDRHRRLRPGPGRRTTIEVEAEGDSKWPENEISETFPKGAWDTADLSYARPLQLDSRSLCWDGKTR